MCDSELNGLEMISEAATGLPAPIKKDFLKAMMGMLGGLSNIPAAWVRRSTQGIDDTTKGRSLVASELAKAVAKEATLDPEILQAAAEVYLPDKVRKTKNRIHVAQRAADYVSGMTEDGANASAPDEDWMNLFSRFAEDATSERLQDMFGRVLAGEVVHPGSFNLRTLRAISEMDQ
ncbi:DUF2806 domain-containing protein [Ruegeria halocynthiae]|uniref:DUF2806 domain-containing protein n=1 Tax=Ruegeria halocynthiae TaxID=985054 RepID=UPI0005640D67|nr:DUF2806 domain-containing protein [Ruegeria halocynthiae]